MARSQNEEAQQIPAEKQENETASHTVLSEVMGKTMQFATTISNKIYDLSLYTGIKFVRTAKRLKKFYLIALQNVKRRYMRTLSSYLKNVLLKRWTSP